MGAWRPRALLAGFAGLLSLSPALADAPRRVMSLNVCTDQLALLIAAPGQLISVSNLASEPDLSFLHENAAGLPQNSGQAEDVLLEKPDLVITGEFSRHNTTGLLRSLGMRVEEFAYAQTLATIPGEMRRMGVLLGREAKGEAEARNFEAALTDAKASACGAPPLAIAWEQNGIALGAGTLADSVLKAAGFRNLAAELGFEGMTPFPLELLMSRKPDVILLPDKTSAAPSLADLSASHPALSALSGVKSGRYVPRGAWSCGGPGVIEAVKALARLRAEMRPCPQGGAS